MCRELLQSQESIKFQLSQAQRQQQISLANQETSRELAKALAPFITEELKTVRRGQSLQSKAPLESEPPGWCVRQCSPVRI